MSSGRLDLFLISLYICRKECSSCSSLLIEGLGKGCIEGIDAVGAFTEEASAVEGAMETGLHTDLWWFLLQYMGCNFFLDFFPVFFWDFFSVFWGLMILIGICSVLQLSSLICMVLLLLLLLWLDGWMDGWLVGWLVS